MRAVSCLLGLAALGAGCAPEPRAAERVERLAPVEADTGSPAAGAATAVRTRLRLAFGASDGQGRASHARMERTDAGTLLAAAEAAPDGFQPCVFVEGLELDAEEASRLSIEARLPRGGELRVRFGAGAAPAELPVVEEAASLLAFPLFDARPSADAPFQERDLLASLRPAWSGTVNWIAIELRPNQGAVELRALEAYDLDLEPGAAQEFASGMALDAGLVTRADATADDARAHPTSRRGYPLRSGRPSSVEFEPVRGATLHLDVARWPGGGDAPVRFGVRLAGRAEPLVELTLDESNDAVHGWHPLVCELPRGASELTFEALGVEDGAWCGLLGSPELHRHGAHRPSLLLVTADTLRADHVGAVRARAGLGALPGLETPNLDALAARGALFTDVLSASNATLPSHASIFTGLPPRDHGVLHNRLRLGPGAPTLTEHLRETGWTTVHASAIEHLNSEPSGLGRGVARYLEQPSAQTLRVPTGTPPILESLPAPLAVALVRQGVEYGVPRALHELERLGSRPAFFWLHLFDPHTPYVPRRATLERLGLRDAQVRTPWLNSLAPDVLGVRTEDEDLREDVARAAPHLAFASDVRSVEFARALYAASISQMDEGLGAFFQAWEARSEFGDGIAFTSDHGEALGERGVWFEHSGLYQNTLQVPLILAGDGVPPGVVVDAPVSTLDLAVTFAAWLGAPAFAGTAGRALLPLAANGTGAPGRRWFQHARDRQVGFREGDDHVVLTRESFRLGAAGRRFAKGELEHLAASASPSGVEEVSQRPPNESARPEIEAWLADRSRAVTAEESELDERAEAALEALGYTE